MHSVSTWTVVTPATTEQTGKSIGICDICGAEQTREDPVLPEPEPEPEPETEPETQPQTEPETQPLTTQPETEPETIPETAPETLPETEPEAEGKHSKAWIPWVLGVAAVALAIGIRHMLSYKPQHAKKRKK